MAFFGYDKLEKLINEKEVITPYDPKLLEGSSYQLTLGDEVFVTNTDKGKKEILDDKNPEIEIKPGQYGLLLTGEKVKIPKDVLAFIGIKFSIKAQGLINISGFHVDPGFSGKLVFAVYNAGASSITLEKGEPIFSIWFSELSGKNTDDSKLYNKESHQYQNQDKIPKKLIKSLKGHLWNPIELTNRIKDLEGLKKNNEYLIKTLIGILIVIGLRVFFMKDIYKNGFDNGYKAKSTIEKIEIQYEDKLDSLINHKVDSIIALKKISN